MAEGVFDAGEPRWRERDGFSGGDVGRPPAANGVPMHTEQLLMAVMFTLETLLESGDMFRNRGNGPPLRGMRTDSKGRLRELGADLRAQLCHDSPDIPIVRLKAAPAHRTVS